MLMISVFDMDKKNQHSHAHRLLRECLKPYNIPYNDDSALDFGKFGKPFLTQYPDIHFNLSHADGICACIVTDSECGIDCEKVREYRLKVAKRVFSDSEIHALESLPENERSLFFFQLWTLKEAFVKAVGKGLSYPMKDVSFSFHDGKIFCSEIGFSFRQYLIQDEKFVVSVCVRT